MACNDVLHELVGGGLGLRREVPLDVDLAEFVRERARREGHAALPPLFLLRSAGERGVVEPEDGVIDLLGQDSAVTAQRADEQLVLEHLERRRLDRPGDAGEGARLVDDQLISLRADTIQIGAEIEARRAALELGDRHLVIGLGRIAALDLSPVGAGDFRFEVEDGLGPCGSVGLARESQHLRQEFEILRAVLRDLGVRLQIIIAVGHADAALSDVQDVLVVLLVIEIDEGRERTADAEAVGAGHQGGIAGLARQRANLVQPRLERRQALGLDSRGVQIGVVRDADLAVRILRRFFDDCPGPALRQIVEQGEHAVVRLVGRDRSGPRPGAVRVGVEIVTRSNGRIHPRLVEAERADLGLGSGRRFGSRRSGLFDRRRRDIGCRGSATGERGARRENGNQFLHVFDPLRKYPRPARPPAQRNGVGPICDRPTSAIRRATPNILQTRRSRRSRQARSPSPEPHRRRAR